MQYEVLSERRAIWQRFMKYSNTSESLKDNRDFQKVYQYGKSAANRTLVLYTKNRVGISVSKKVGNSVVRHHLCRLVRESYRLNEDKFDRGLDLVVIVRPGARELPFSDIDRALLHVSRKLGVLQNREGAEKKNTIGESR